MRFEKSPDFRPRDVGEAVEISWLIRGEDVLLVGVGRRRARDEGAMGLYERIVEEREEEKRRRGRPLGPYYGMDSLVLDCKADNPPATRPRYGSDLYRLYCDVHSRDSHDDSDGHLRVCSKYA